jgi:hypothetical protein
VNDARSEIELARVTVRAALGQSAWQGLPGRYLEGVLVILDAMEANLQKPPGSPERQRMEDAMFRTVADDGMLYNSSLGDYLVSLGRRYNSGG